MVETIYLMDKSPDIALLADMHGRADPQALEMIRRRRPSAVCVAGDISYGDARLNREGTNGMLRDVLPFLKACAETAPVFLSLGNHDAVLTKGDLEAVAAAGVHILDNGYARARIGGVDAVIGGLTSGYVLFARRNAGAVPPPGRRFAVRRKVPEAEVRPETGWLRDFVSEPGYRILLCHHPEYRGLLPDGIDLVLCGHAHGGQWRYFSPLTLRTEGVYAPGQGVFPKYTSGIHGNMVISRGMTNTAPVPRLFNPVETVFIS